MNEIDQVLATINQEAAASGIPIVLPEPTEEQLEAFVEAFQPEETEAETAPENLNLEESEPEAEAESEDEGAIKFENTFEVTLVVTQQGDPGADLDLPDDFGSILDLALTPWRPRIRAGVLEEVKAPRLGQAANVKGLSINVRKIGTSPNRVPYLCPNDFCNLRWVHRVDKDDPKYTPEYCAYCARDFDRGDRADQVAINTQGADLMAELADLQGQFDGIDSASAKAKDLNSKIALVNDQIEKLRDAATAVKRETQLVLGTPYNGR